MKKHACTGSLQKPQRAKRIAAKPVKNGWFTAVFSAVLLCGALGSLLCFLAVLRAGTVQHAVFGTNYTAAAAAGVCVGAGLCVGAYLARHSRAVLLAGLGAFAIFCFVARAQLYEGCLFVVRTAAVRFFEVFPKYGYLPFEFTQALAENGALFVFACAILLVAYLAWAVLWHQSFWLCLLGTGPFFGFTFVLYGLTYALPTVLVFTCWVALLAKGAAGRFAPRQTARLTAGGLAVALLFFSVVTAVFPRHQYTAWPGVFVLRNTAQNAWAQVQAAFSFGPNAGTFSGAPLAGRQGNIDLNDTGSLRFTQGTALRVWGDTALTRYLRGYSSAVYTGHGWQQLPQGVYEEENFPFQPLTYEPLKMFSSANTPAQRINIEMVAGPADFTFTPYLLQEVAHVEESPGFVQDAYLAAPSGATSYAANFYGRRLDAAGYLNRAPMREKLLDAYRGTYEVSFYSPAEAYVYGDDTTYEVPGYTAHHGPIGEMPGTLLFIGETEYYAGQAFAYENLEMDDTTYVDYIQRAYTQLPEGTGQALREVAETAGLRPAQHVADWGPTAVAVAEYLRGGLFTYTQTPGPQPQNEDFALHFLTQSRQGYCQHFATAGATMLRALGVPARLAEGYVLGTAPFDNEEWVDVPAKNAHAWVEVWMPGVGWLPLEVTPGGSDAQRTDASPPQTASSQAQSSSSQAPAPVSSAPEVSSSQGSASSSPALGPVAAPPLPPYIKAVLCAVGVVCALCATFAVYRRRRQAQRRRHFTQKDINAAVIAHYAYLVRLRRFGYTPTEQAAFLAGKARFSQHTLAKAELAAMQKEVQLARAYLVANLPFLKRLLFYLLTL